MGQDSSPRHLNVLNHPSIAHESYKARRYLPCYLGKVPIYDEWNGCGVNGAIESEVVDVMTDQ